MKLPNTQQLKQTVVLASKYRLIIAWVLILALFGYTLMQMRGISGPEPDQQYLEQQRQDIEAAVLNIDEDLRVQIESLLETPVDTTPGGLGTRDPFNP